MSAAATSERYLEPGAYQRTDIQAMLRRSQDLCTRDPDAFQYEDLITIQAPMVRCSRPPFRKLCRLWGTKISYTHMIMSNSFSKSAEARAADFGVYDGEDLLIAQIAGTNVGEMTETARMLAPFCDAVDINCGCPQRWAMKEGIGSAMLEKPELTAEIVKSIVQNSGVPCVVKMRVYEHEDIHKSVDFARMVEAAGASWVTVHGRTPWDQPSCDVRVEAVRTVRDAIHVPLVANGSVESVESALWLARACGVGGVMSARGLLSNPACFDREYGSSSATSPPIAAENGSFSTEEALAAAAGATTTKRKWPVAPLTPRECISDFVRLSALMDLQHKAFLHHVLLMANDLLSPTERSFLSQQKSFVSVVQLLRECGIYVDEGRFAL